MTNKIKVVYYRFFSRKERFESSLEDAFKSCQADIEWNTAYPYEIWDGDDLIWSREDKETLQEAADKWGWKLEYD